MYEYNPLTVPSIELIQEQQADAEECECGGEFDEDDKCDSCSNGHDAFLTLTRGLSARVDLSDYDELAKYRWYATDTGYAARRESDSAMVYMHRQILGLTEKNVHGDHINGDKLDNRRSNLRACTQTENNRNTNKRNMDTTSKYKGVSWVSEPNRVKRWRVTIVKDGKQVACERYEKEIVAALRYNELALLHHGEFASLNEIPDGIVCPDCWEDLDEEERCGSCTFGHFECDERDCFPCFERAVDRAERMAEGDER